MTAFERQGDGRRATPILCFAVAMVEGFDLQAAGVAAPRIASSMGLTPADLGWFFSAASIGLVAGALIGGRIGDHVGRKAGLVIAVIAFGLASLAVAIAHNYEVLLMLRLATGIGLGGALPNLVAITAESGVTGRRSRAVGLAYAGMPAGGAVAALVAVLTSGGSWQTIFLVGGIAPLLLAPLLWRYLHPTVEPGRTAPPATVRAALFAEGRAASTIGLWTGFFASLLILYLLLNWLPALLVSKGLTARDATLIQIAFNAAGALCSALVGQALDRFSPTRVAVIAFALLITGLVALALVPAAQGGARYAAVTLAAAFAGAMVVAVQTVAYATAPQLYPLVIRGTGVGAAVAAGRLGSVAGPLTAGWLLAGGRTPTDVLLGLVPVAVVAAAAIVFTLRRGEIAR